MSADIEPRNPLPWWMKLIIVVSSLPVLALPRLISSCPPGAPEETFLRFYPVYVAVAALCAWLSYGRRPELTWIIVVLMWLTHGAMWMLVGLI